MKCGLHILDDSSDLSPRARAFLARAAWRATPGELPRADPVAPVVRRFVRRYGGLRYVVRRATTVEGTRIEANYAWWYDPGTLTQESFFDWIGERVSTPCRYLVHTDGRVGINEDPTTFQEIAPSLPALIEAHALTDQYFPWEMRPAAIEVARRLDGLTLVPEASGPTVRWLVSGDVAVNEFQEWTEQTPRRWRAFIWTRRPPS